VYGVNPITGFALRPFDNVGVQYGLAALNAGVISPTQFLNVNERIGGYDQDANYVANRSVGDIGAIKRAQQAGVNLVGGGGLASIPCSYLGPVRRRRYLSLSVASLRGSRADESCKWRYGQPRCGAVVWVLLNSGTPTPLSGLGSRKYQLVRLYQMGRGRAIR
jgi:hypothetical protein